MGAHMLSGVGLGCNGSILGWLHMFECLKFFTLLAKVSVHEGRYALTSSLFLNQTLFDSLFLFVF
ncbi:hypothetical protein MPER_12536 [Moniliophthora perniciosa FA553]|nr:hypothetical protein MPER_12536 [Moniliophthora perniciosa FA553]